MPVRLRAADVARIEAVRGDENRSEWARGAIRAALQVEGAYALIPPAGSPLQDPDEQARVLADVAAREPDGTPRKTRKRAAAPRTVTAAAPGVPPTAFQEPAEPERRAAQCPPHPKGRVTKGFCGACARPVGDEAVR